MRTISFSRTAVFLLMALLLLSQLLSLKLARAQSLPPGSNLRTSVINVQTDSNFSASYDGYKARDGVVSDLSKWTSTNASSTHWLAYDLGALRNVTGYVVRHAGAANEPTYLNTAAFRFQSSSSMSGPWVDETSTIYNSANVSVYTYASARQLRYVRLLITDAGIDDYARIPEFEVYGSTGSTPANPPGSNLRTSVINVQTDSNFSASYDGYKARDGVVSDLSKWTSTNASSTHWLAYDLGALRNVTGYVVRHAGAANESTAYNTAAFRFQSGSSINGPWVDETNTIYNSANVSVYTYASARQLRYVRLLITDAGIDDYARIPEFEVWGSNISAPTQTSKLRVIEIRYFPDAPLYHPNTLSPQLQQLLREASRFHGYNTSSVPSVEVEVVAVYNRNGSRPNINNNWHSTYQAILAQDNLCTIINTQGIDQVWMWVDPVSDPNPGQEYAISSPYFQTGAQYATVATPAFCGGQRSFIFMGFDTTRPVENALHSVGHAMEGLLGNIQSVELFWYRYGGRDTEGFPESERCGNVHFPPNTDTAYDYSNARYISSACENWNPQGTGARTTFNCNRWGCSQQGFLTWWMQNMPNAGNSLTYQGKLLPNWWDFTHDLDQNIQKYLNNSSYHMNSTFFGS